MQQTSLETNRKNSRGTRFTSVSRESEKPLRVLMMGPSLEQQGGMATVENLIMQKVAGKIQIRHVMTHEEGTIFHRVWIFCIAISRFLSNLLKGDCDLVHLHVSERGSVVRVSILILIARFFRKPVITHAHGCEFHSFYDSLPPLLQQYISWVLKQCIFIFVLSKSWRNYYVNRCGLAQERTIVLTNPVDFPKSIPDRSCSSRITFLFLGHIGKRKGAFDLLYAFADLPEQERSQSNLILAGDGDVEEACNLAETLGIESSVSLPGWLSQEKCKDLLAQADVFILPSYNEALPMAILEAMSWGLPVISTTVGGIPEIIVPRKTGILVNPGNIQEIKKAMQLCIENKELRISWGLAARRCVAPLAIENYSSHLVNIYRKAVTSTKLTAVDCLSMPSIDLDEN